MVSSETVAPRLKVFVSYCGSDEEFAETLIRGLLSDGRFEISLDPDTTIEEEEWKALISKLIADADAVVFVLSQDAAQTCDWEIECAKEHSKHIVPVLCQPLDSADTPIELTGPKFIRFVKGRPFHQTLSVLTGLLIANREWLHDHTRLLKRARRWEAEGRPNHLLLTGTEIAPAKMWTLSRPDSSPKPTDLHMTFINTSEAVETARRNVIMAMRAEHDELAALEELRKPYGGRQRWVNQAFVVMSCLLAFLVVAADWQISNLRKRLADAQNYASEACNKPIAHRQIALAVSDRRVNTAGCQPLQDEPCVHDHLASERQCSPSGQ